jgi:hypothetical protein
LRLFVVGFLMRDPFLCGSSLKEKRIAEGKGFLKGKEFLKKNC